MKAENVAGLFLCWANNDKQNVTSAKMSKILYYAQGWHLAKFKKPLFENKIEAFEAGPALENIYCSIKPEFDKEPIKYCSSNLEEKLFSQEQLEMLKKVYASYMPMPVNELIELTKSETPWLKSYQPDEANVIPQKLMESFFTDHLRSS